MAGVSTVDMAVFERQLQSIVDEYGTMRRKSKYSDVSDLPKQDRQALVTRAAASVRRISGANSTYSKDIERLVEKMPNIHEHMTSVVGVAQALLDDMNAGYTKSLVETVHADVFADYLEMAEHLCDSSYKDAAAVLAGSTLDGDSGRCRSVFRGMPITGSGMMAIMIPG
jgi:hypothetical protein